MPNTAKTTLYNIESILARGCSVMITGMMKMDKKAFVRYSNILPYKWEVSVMPTYLGEEVRVVLFDDDSTIDTIRAYLDTLD